MHFGVGRTVAGLHFASGEGLESFAPREGVCGAVCNLHREKVCKRGTLRREKGCKLAFCIGRRFGRCDSPERCVASLHFASGEGLADFASGEGVRLGAVQFAILS